VTRLEKSQKVLHTLYSGRDSVTFGYEDEDTGDEVAVLILSINDWEDFGRPMTVTVTIEPGDLLNG
jgi:hypothetical protein